MNRRLDSVAIALNLPKAPAEKLEKLKMFFLTHVQKIDPEITKDDIDVPTDGNGACIGIMFVLCKDSGAAKNLASRGDNLQFDKKTKLRFFTRDQYEKYLNQPTPPPKPIVGAPPEEPLSLSWYYTNPQLLDQIVYAANKLPHAVWFNHNSASLVPIDLPSYIKQTDDINFTEDGSFFITRNGNRLSYYCTEKWILFTTIEWPNLDSYISSPCGRFVLTKARIPVDIDNIYTPNGAALWDVYKGPLLTRIPLNREDYHSIAFGYGSHLLQLSNRHLRVFKQPDFRESQELCADADYFAPSPVTSLVFTFREARESTPPRIAFHSTETLKTVHVNAAFNAVHCEPVWHPKLAMCAVIQDRCIKNREFSSLVVFDLTNENSVCTYTEDLQGSILGCSWDPTNRNVAIIMATALGRQLRIFEVARNMNAICSHPCAGVSGLQFSPSGRFIVADDIKAGGSIVQFWDTQAGLILSKDLDGVDALQWDPSGAFIIASASKRSNTITWFSIILLDGQQVLKSKVTDLANIMWRPRSAEQLLKKEDLEKVKDEADAVIARSGRFGAIDMKSREEELKQQKIEKMRIWMKSIRPPYVSHRDEEPIEFMVDPSEEHFDD